MKIFATSDIHGNRRIMDKLRPIAEGVDLVLVCGDIGRKVRGKSIRQRAEEQRQDADYLTAVLQSVGTELRFILGNGDWFEYTGGSYLRTAEVIGGLRFVPFEYVRCTPFGTNREANENMLAYQLSRLAADGSTVIVAHTPPLGAGDTVLDGSRCGSPSVRAWIEEVQPRLWLCGHIHEDHTAVRIGHTLVLNCACSAADDLLRGWIVDTDTMTYTAVEV